MRIECDTLTHAETIYSAISNRLIGKDVFETHNLFVGQTIDTTISADSKNMVSFDFRFNGDADRDDLKDYIKDQVENHPTVKTWVISASLSWHRCTHDDPSVKNCKTTEFFEWSK